MDGISAETKMLSSSNPFRPIRDSGPGIKPVSWQLKCGKLSPGLPNAYEYV